MFAPDADVSPHTGKKISGLISDPRSIEHGNTRLPEQDETTSSSRSEPPSPTQSRINAAIAGVSCVLSQSSLFFSAHGVCI
jgi:protein DGCR14